MPHLSTRRGGIEEQLTHQRGAIPHCAELPGAAGLQVEQISKPELQRRSVVREVRVKLSDGFGRGWFGRAVHKILAHGARGALEADDSHAARGHERHVHSLPAERDQHAGAGRRASRKNLVSVRHQVDVRLGAVEACARGRVAPSLPPVIPSGMEGGGGRFGGGGSVIRADDAERSTTSCKGSGMLGEAPHGRAVGHRARPAAEAARTEEGLAAGSSKRADREKQ